MNTILIIEDEPSICMGLKDELEHEYAVTTASNGKEGLDLAWRVNPDLILLDILLPDINGFDLCAMMKDKGIDSSIIMVTACHQVVDKIKGLEMGADDYITKPFSLEELKARVQAVLRRRAYIPVEIFEDNVLQIDFKKLYARKKGKELKLSYMEFKLLRYLVFKKGDIVSRKELLLQVWGYQMEALTRTVDAHIGALRKKIGKNYITTIHGVGYSFRG